jgi:hypothetical protein
MKFLQLILIGSLTLSAAAPCYTFDNQPPLPQRVFDLVDLASIVTGVSIFLLCLAYQKYTQRNEETPTQRFAREFAQAKHPGNTK